ncbi:lysophospholipase L1-like esterase [Paenibacillus phyllosphaerae]|uniref:Lysophospholipase L1-like esterase n=1 Tax=Paenibacillus phyllosphaerae TaxID=274593 RepID=A0A7W5AY46_9BACL|nr:GDSL-type esterase/lipase family protein [Paenibacillus phyllosphaerae]MBB3110431.1 lysophospholipase L1-like esterase [Paenibacillus phyllosphaerae]
MGQEVGALKQTSTRRLWRWISIISLASTLLLVFGFGYAAKDLIWPQAEPYTAKAPEAELPEAGLLSESSEIRITALGDSLTKGFGDDTGQGYVKHVAAFLKEKWNKPVSVVNNLAINGLRADGLAKLIAGNKGYQYPIQQANLIVLTIGGNDLFQSVTGEKASEATGEFDLKQLEQGIPSGLERLKSVLDQIHKLNPNAHVVYVGLYNPFYDMDELKDASLYIAKWNQEAYSIVHQYPNMTLVPTYDLFESALSDYLSTDHFHPNHAGYEQIAVRIVQALK